MLFLYLLWRSWNLKICISKDFLTENFYLQYKIEKKVEPEEPAEPAMPDNPLMRKKKTPEELAAEAEAADQDEFTSKQSCNNYNSLG